MDTWFPAVGGGQINAWEISKRLTQEGVSIDIITRNCGKDQLANVKNLKIYKLGSRSDSEDPLSKIIFLARAFFFVFKRDYDLVHAHAFLPGIVARSLMVFKGIPAIFGVHGTSIGTKLNNIFLRWLEKFILTQIRYSAQITASRDFLKIKNINKKIVYIPNGVDIREFNYVRTQKFQNPTLIFVGRLHRQKNLSSLIRCIDLLKQEFPQVQLLVIGRGEERNELAALIKNLGLGKNIKLLGEITGRELIKLYKSSHLFILPSIYEGQPLTLLEAWAAKLPAVVPKTGDCQYLIKNGVNGYLVDNQNDPQELAKTVKNTLQNKNLEKLGQNGYNFVKKNFSWDKSARKTLEVYKRVTKA